MKKNAKILVAGATGMVGSAIIRTLLNKGYRNIVGTYRSKNPYIMYRDYSFELEKGLLTFIKVDFTSQSETERIFSEENPAYVFLSAAKVGGILANNIYRADFIYQNLQIQNNIIHFSYKYNVEKLLFLGSTCVYPRRCPQPIKEEYLLTEPLEYTNEPYAVAKIAGLKMCESYNLQYGTNFISVMPTNLFGYWDNFDLRSSHVIPALIRKFHLAKALMNEDWDTIMYDLRRFPLSDTGTPASKSDAMHILIENGIYKRGNKVIIKIWGTGKPKRDFLWVDDLAEACVFLMEHIDYEDIINSIYGESIDRLKALKKEIRNTHINIGTGESVTIKELAHLIKQVVGFMGEISFDPTKPDGMPVKVTDVSRIHRLGWRHKTSLMSGLKKLYAWYVNNIVGGKNVHFGH